MNREEKITWIAQFIDRYKLCKEALNTLNKNNVDLDNDYDIVIASREGVGAVRHNEPFHRHLMGRVFNYLVQLIFLAGDHHNKFKIGL